MDDLLGFADEVEIVEYDDEAGRGLGQVAEQQARQADAFRAIREAAPQPGHRRWVLEAGIECVGEAGEQAPGVAVSWLEGQPDNRRTAITRIGCGEGTFAK